jgi:hypothetical protein
MLTYPLSGTGGKLGAVKRFQLAAPQGATYYLLISRTTISSLFSSTVIIAVNYVNDHDF